MAETVLSKLNFYPDSGTQRILSVPLIKRRKIKEPCFNQIVRGEKKVISSLTSQMFLNSKSPIISQKNSLDSYDFCLFQNNFGKVFKENKN